MASSASAPMPKLKRSENVTCEDSLDSILALIAKSILNRNMTEAKRLLDIAKDMNEKIFLASTADMKKRTEPDYVPYPWEKDADFDEQFLEALKTSNRTTLKVERLEKAYLNSL
jgi:hypothetical protein